MGGTVVWTLAAAGGWGRDAAEPVSIGVTMIAVAAQPGRSAPGGAPGSAAGALARPAAIPAGGRVAGAGARGGRRFRGRPGAGRFASQSVAALGGFVDAYYAYDGNRPADHANFFPGVGTSAKRHNEFSVNLAQVDLTLDPDPVGFRSGARLRHGARGRPRGGGARRRRRIPTSGATSSRPPFSGRRAWAAGCCSRRGIFPSHIGMEAFQTKDNWNYTRSWLGELSPYYQTGLKMAYPFSDRWSGQLHILNGWQMIGDGNDGKSVGAQIAYAYGDLSLSPQRHRGAGAGRQRRRPARAGRRGRSRTRPRPA